MEILRQLLLIGLFGAAGAVCRYGISLGVNRLAGESFPAGTFLVNIVGCFLLGLLAGLATARPEQSHALPPSLRDAIAIGFLGALTTFSTFSLDAIKCLERAAHATAIGYVLGSVVVGLLVGYAGLIGGRSIGG